MTLHGESFENDGPSSATTAAPVRESKETLRHSALSRRKRTTAAERMAAGEALALHFPLPLLGADPATMSVAAYVSMGTEVETRPLLTLLLDRGCTVMVPRLGSGRDIGWSVLTDVTMLRAVDQPGHLRPDEPIGRILPPDALSQCGLVIAPALGVDPRGYRLGRGAGWYDRALALRRPDCPLIAVCWPWEVMGEPLPTENHDVPADAVLTPEGYRRLRR
ncbi:5-formyltetrahydrofolate cyclo-ligase [Bifidobacterium myosotis]|uniref:5-formyltetrahydrofolate cyclo-ligase n=2 Tax=Bifidobacterium myosotis TaxID=1630166 RepID=A0A261FQG1_9BIFI|nr:5-formyltetrahydrofolate cyclo-ligase [Bifidobacterium myosotis]OZG61397.1 5-formyltetrahydrofolate cyclo-ligase [Bifidobacterium myosotis]